LFDSFSCGFPYFCSTPFLCFVLSTLIHLSPFLYYPLFHFGVFEVLSEILYLFLCLLMLFIFGFLKCLGAYCTFWLTMSSIFSINFSMISSKINSLRLFMWVLLGFLVTFVIVLGIHFLHFPLNLVLNFFF
jgi:hypothetical protein